MLEMRKTALSFDEKDLMELERVITDGDANEAMKYLKKVVYDRIAHAQTGRLKSHLDGGGDPTQSFKSNS